RHVPLRMRVACGGTETPSPAHGRVAPPSTACGESDRPSADGDRPIAASSVRGRWGAAWRLGVWGWLLGCCAAYAVAPGDLFAQSDAPAAETTPSRPRIGLVLSGGGARGIAHVGVLRALE